MNFKNLNLEQLQDAYSKNKNIHVRAAIQDEIDTRFPSPTIEEINDYQKLDSSELECDNDEGCLICGS